MVLPVWRSLGETLILPETANANVNTWCPIPDPTCHDWTVVHSCFLSACQMLTVAPATCHGDVRAETHASRTTAMQVALYFGNTGSGNTGSGNTGVCHLIVRLERTISLRTKNQSHGLSCNDNIDGSARWARGDGRRRSGHVRIGDHEERRDEGPPVGQ